VLFGTDWVATANRVLSAPIPSALVSSERIYVWRNPMLLLIIVLLLLFGGGGGYYGYSRWGTGGGLGVVGTVVVIALLLYFLGVIH
jgi:hypothetical protein